MFQWKPEFENFDPQKSLSPSLDLDILKLKIEAERNALIYLVLVKIEF